MESACARLRAASDQIRVCLATYFGDLAGNLPAALGCRWRPCISTWSARPSSWTVPSILSPPGMVLSLGVIDGRNVWRADLDRALGLLERAAARLGSDRIMVGPLLLALALPDRPGQRASLDAELKGWMAFAKQKLREMTILARAVNGGRAAVADELAASRVAVESRSRSTAHPQPGGAPSAWRSVGDGDAPPRASVCRAPRGPAAAAGPAASAHHHDRLVSADRRGPQGPRRLEEGPVVGRAVRRVLQRGNQADGPLSGGDRPGRVGPRRVRAGRHGRVFRRAVGGFRLYGQRLGAELRHPLREAAGDLRRRVAAAADDASAGAATPSRLRRGR